MTDDSDSDDDLFMGPPPALDDDDEEEDFDVDRRINNFTEVCAAERLFI